MSAPRTLSGDAVMHLQSLENEIYLSVASVWEISIKHALGKLRLPRPPVSYLPEALRRSGVTVLAISVAHATRVSELPPLHRDPFDRMLIAQAQLDEMSLVTADRAIRAYDVRTVAAD